MYSCSQFVATIDVYPAEAKLDMSAWRPPPAPAAGSRRRNPGMVQTCSMVGGATIWPCVERRAASGSVYTGLSSPMASHQWRIMAWLTGSRATTGSPYGAPTSAWSDSWSASAPAAVAVVVPASATDRLRRRCVLGWGVWREHLAEALADLRHGVGRCLEYRGEAEEAVEHAQVAMAADRHPGSS